MQFSSQKSPASRYQLVNAQVLYSQAESPQTLPSQVTLNMEFITYESLQCV